DLPRLEGHREVVEPDVERLEGHGRWRRRRRGIGRWRWGRRWSWCWRRRARGCRRDRYGRWCRAFWLLDNGGRLVARRAQRLRDRRQRRGRDIDGLTIARGRRQRNVQGDGSGHVGRRRGPGDPPQPRCQGEYPT